MIDAYLFIAAFAVQILLISVLIPRRLLQRIQEAFARNPPDPRGAVAAQRTLQLYRRANGVIAVIGLGLMAGLFMYMRQSGWDEDPLPFLLTAYFLVQFLPIAVLGAIGVYLGRTLKQSFAGERRTAVLQRRELFDFISPTAVFLTLLCYPAFVLLALYVGRHPVVVIATISAIYGLVAFLVHGFIHSGKNNPRQSHAEHMHVIGANVRIMIYSCLIAVLSVMSNLLLVVIDRQHLVPVVACCTFAAVGAWMYRNMQAPPLEAPPGPLHAAH